MFSAVQVWAGLAPRPCSDVIGPLHSSPCSAWASLSCVVVDVNTAAAPLLRRGQAHLLARGLLLPTFKLMIYCVHL